MNQYLHPLCIITVNYNLASDTIACVRSLLDAGAELGQIIVVDNASSDGSIEQLRAVFGEALVIVASETNLGYAGGINLGVEEALRRGCDWLLLMNNDTTVAPDFLSEMARAAKAPNTLLGPAIFYYDHPDIIWSMGETRVRGTLFGMNPFHNRPLKPDLPALLPVDFLNGCCMLVHRAVFEAIGNWSTAYYMYVEEVDFCWRAHQAGFRMASVPSAHMYHKVSFSARKLGNQAIYLRVRNQNWFYRRYSSTLQRLIMAPLSLLRNLVFATKLLVKGEGRAAWVPLAGWYGGWFEMKG